MKNYKLLASTSVSELAESLGVDPKLFDGYQSFSQIVSIMGLEEYFYTPTQVLTFTADEFFNNFDIQSKVAFICCLPPYEGFDDAFYNYSVEFGFADIGNGDELLCYVRAVKSFL